jgi:hypothetical protein
MEEQSGLARACRPWSDGCWWRRLVAGRAVPIAVTPLAPRRPTGWRLRDPMHRLEDLEKRPERRLLVWQPDDARQSAGLLPVAAWDLSGPAHAQVLALRWRPSPRSRGNEARNALTGSGWTEPPQPGPRPRWGGAPRPRRPPLPPPRSGSGTPPGRRRG